MSVKGFDISSNNGEHIDFKAAKRAGYDFVYIKVSQGTSYVNPYAAKHAQEARDAGLLVGAYCFVSPSSSRTGAQEADYFIANARKAGLLKKGDLRPVADIEITALPKGKPSRKYHYDFVKRVDRHLGFGSFGSFDGKVFIYTGSWFWDGVLGAKNAHGSPLWLAAYSKFYKRFIPQGFTKGVSIHQYTDKGRVPGVAGDVDLDTYLGKSLLALKNRHALRRSV